MVRAKANLERGSTWLPRNPSYPPALVVYLPAMSQPAHSIGVVAAVIGRPVPSWSRLTAGLLASLALLLVGVGDYLTGWYFLFDFFYLIPLSLMTLYVGRRAGIAMAIACTVAWVSVMEVQQHPMATGLPSPTQVIWLWNFFTRLLVQGAFVLLISKLRDDVRRERELNSKLQSALEQITQLRELMPICAWCKKIRDDAGYWKQLDHYLQEHELATFTHGICPDCADKAFPP